MGNTNNVILNFIKEHYVAIMLGFIKAYEETGLNKKELLLEADFKPGPKGEMAPALNGKFKIGVTRHYLEGDRPEELDWFYKYEDKRYYKTNIDSILPGLRNQYEIMTDKTMLLYCRFNLGYCVKRLCVEEMFSNEALEAFKKASNNDEYGPMSMLFSPTVVEQVKCSIMHSQGRIQQKWQMYQDMMSFGPENGIFLACIMNKDRRIPNMRRYHQYDKEHFSIWREYLLKKFKSHLTDMPDYSSLSAAFVQCVPSNLGVPEI